MKKFIKKYDTQIIVAILTTLFLEIVFSFVLHFYPFHKANLLVSDLYYEYVPFFCYVRDAILNGKNILNSFSFTLGQSIVGILAYYCLSPLNLIILFSNNSNIVYFIKVLIFLKLILCGLNMSIYLKDKTSKLNNVIFSLIFAFISYNLRYAFNLMWLDVVYMLPLAILGLEKLIEGKSNKLYIVSLTIMIFSNFYIAFNACIFIVIYFFFYSIIKNKLTFKLFWKFIYSSLIAALLNAFMLIPTFYNMINGKAISAVSGYDKLILYNPLNVIYNFAPGPTAGNALVDLPYFYSSTLLIVLFINYLFNEDVGYKEKALSFVIVLFLIFSTLIGPLDLLFHCFKVPNSLYYRYMYILPFFFISIVSRHKIKISWFCLIPIDIIIIWAIAVEQSVKMIVFSTLLLLYPILFKADLKYILVLVAVSELFYNAANNLNYYDGFGSYHDVLDYGEKLKDYYPEENEFYRIEVGTPITVNDSFILNYYAVDSFSPTISNASKIFLKDYLLTAEKNSLNYVYQNRFILDSYFLGIKYELVDNKVKENEYYLPLVIKASNLSYFKPTNSLVENSNNLYRMINGEYLFNEIDFKIDCIKDNFVVNKKCNIDYSKKEGYNYLLEIIVLSENVFEKSTYLENNVLLEVDESFDFDYDNIHIDSVKLYEYDKKSIKTQENNLEVFKDNYIRLKIDKGTYMTTIPYDESWHIRVNGKEVKKIKVLDSLIGFEAEEGILELEFIPQGLLVGTIISGITFLSIFTYFFRKKDIK